MKIKICIFLIVSTLAVYSQVQNHEFLNYDDDSYVTENRNLKDGLTGESIIWAFTTSTLNEWAPINWLSYLIDYELHGLNPKGYHLTNLFFHISNTLLLFIVFLRMTGAIWQSAMVAAMFALHPFNVDSVAWIAERKNVLSTFFWFLTMWAYLHYIEKPNAKRYIFIALFLAFGLMSKAMLITLPFALLLLDFWPLGRFGNANKTVSSEQTRDQITFAQLIQEKIPLFVLTGGSITASLLVIGDSLTSSYSLQERLINALSSYLFYLKKMIWPSGFSIFYPYPVNDLPISKGIVAGVILVIITLIVIRLLKRAPFLAVGWLWYLGTLVPVIGILQMGEQAVADRYAYIPLIGIFIMIAWGLPELIRKWRYREVVLTISAGIYIFILMIVTGNQVSHWKNSITIFEHALRVTDKIYPGLSLVHHNLAIALRKQQRIGEAINHYRISVQLEPNYPHAHFNLGNALSSVGKKEEAISHYKKAINLNPNFAQAHNNLAVVLKSFQKTEEAIAHYKIAVKLKPDYTHAHFNLGNALLDKGKKEEAVTHFKTAVNLDPNFTSAQNSLKIALDQINKKN